MVSDRSLAVVVAGPNGAGKSTTAPHLLQGALAVHEFVNADAIATGLSAFRPDSAAIAAGRIMVERLRELARARADFAFETTLASRSFSPWLNELRLSGYRTHLIFLSLRNADLAVARVADRRRAGGHDVPEAVVRRRYKRGLFNLFHIYPPVLDSWQVFDNSTLAPPRIIASCREANPPKVIDASAWKNLIELEQA